MTSTEQAVAAAAELAGRAGATSFEIGWDCRHVKVGNINLKTHDCDDVKWWAAAYYRGGRVVVDGFKQSDLAATGLATRLMTGATCKCRRVVVLDDKGTGCHWKLVGDRWESGCDAPSVLLKPEQRGDLAAMRKALRVVPKPDSQDSAL